MAAVATTQGTMAVVIATRIGDQVLVGIGAVVAVGVTVLSMLVSLCDERADGWAAVLASSSAGYFLGHAAAALATGAVVVS